MPIPKPQASEWNSLRAKVVGGALLLVLLGIGVVQVEVPPEPGGPDTQLGMPFHTEGCFNLFGPAKGLPWSGDKANLIEADSANSTIQTGTLRSSPFNAPGFLKFYVTGYPNSADMQMYLQNIKTAQTLDLLNGMNPGASWRMRQWKIPSAWRGAEVILVVRDGGKGPLQWIGISEPHRGSRPLIASATRMVHRNSLLILLSLAFLLPGTAIILAAAKLRVPVDFKRAVSLVLGGSAFAAYAVFWIYLWSRAAAIGMAWTVFIASVISIAFSMRKTRLTRMVRTRLAWCLVTVLTVSIFYNALGSIHEEDNDLGQFTQQRYLPQTLPPDNLLPELFAERIYDLNAGGKPLTDPLLGFWRASDRPPLQTAIALLEMPFAQKKTRSLHYQLLGVFLQCTWIAGLWALLHSVGIRSRFIASVIAFAVVSDFCLVHSFYIWPKLFAATFCLLGLSFFPWRTTAASWNALDVSLTGMMLGFALLTHPGVIFTVVPAAAIMYRKRPRIRVAAWGVACLLLLQLPWMGYQKLVDPPGDNLLKLHLAGSVDLHHSLWQSVRAAYSGLTVQQYLWNKLANVGALFGGGLVKDLLADDWRTSLDAFLVCNFFYVSFTLGLLCTGLLVRLFGGPHKGSRAWRVADRFLLVAAGTLLLWCFIMFEPGSTIVHQGSFATVLLLFASCALYLAEFMQVLLWVLLTIQVCVFFPIFIFGKDMLVASGGVLDNPLDPGMTLTALVSFALLVFFYRRTQTTSAYPPPL